MQSDRRLKDPGEKKKPVLILDYDGTLHDSSAIYEPAFRRTMTELQEQGWIPKEEYTSEEINYWVGFTAQEMWLKFHPELSDEQRNTAGRRIGKYMMEALRTGRGRLYEGVRETLEALHQDYELVFLSNCMSDYASVHREIFGLDRWIDRYFCTGDYGFKPKEEVFEKYIREPGRQYIAVGDRMKDRRLAESCGLPFIGCLYGFGTVEELQPADALIESVSELKAAADRIRRNSRHY